MNFVSAFMAIFAIIGGLDLLIGNRFGIGKEFEKGFKLFGNLALSMIGMIVLTPLLGAMMTPISNWIYGSLHIDPSLLPSLLFANDMGGASLAGEMARSEEWGFFNGLVVSSMMGCTISFTIPVALRMVKQEQQKHMMMGFLCGIAAIPAGCFAAGLIRGISILPMFVQLLPLICISALIVFGLAVFPKFSIRLFGILGSMIKNLVTVGLILGVVQYLTGVEMIKGLGTLEEGAGICVNICVVMSGAFPFLYLVSKVISKPLKSVGKKIGMNEASVMGFFSSLATSITTFESMKDMDEKGVVLNSAFLIPAAYTFAGHLAFTMSFHGGYLGTVIVGKLGAGILAVIFASVVYRRIGGSIPIRS